MYTEFFGFREKPFNLVPDPNYLFLSSRHENALTFLEYGLSEKVGFIMLTGEVGMGKTTLIRHLLNQNEAETETAVVFNTNVDALTLLRQILNEFEIPHGGVENKADLLELLYGFLIEKFAEGRRVFLIIDEAQNLSNDTLEEIRMLSNLQTDKELLLQIILVGQPNLRDKIRSPELEQFAQRIAASFHLSAMDRDETQGYIVHRMQTAGGDPGLFLPALYDRLFEVSGGIPRTVNLLCDGLLVYGYAEGASVLTPALLDQVIEDKGGMGMFTPGNRDSAGDGAGIDSRPGFEERLAALENRVEDLRRTLDDRLELVSTMKRLYAEEKKKNRILAYRYGKLKEKYDRLRPGREPVSDIPISLNEVVK
ncbi:MAG: AAA family ATPase [Desulfobacter sp.]|nr:MAG: AAA family ATPase [Desulfobacter sp.]